jgi:hypothetical protein
MTLSAFTAYKDSDNKLHTSLEAAQTAERRIMFAAAFDAAVHGNPQLARLDKALVVAFCMTLGKTIGDIANDRLAPQGVGPGGARPADYVPNVLEHEERAREVLRGLGPVRTAFDKVPVERLTPATPAEKSEADSVSTGEKAGRFQNARTFPGGGIVGDRAVGKLPALGEPFRGTAVADAAAGAEPVGAGRTGDSVDDDIYAAVARELGDDPNRTDFGKHPLDPAVSRAEGMEPSDTPLRSVATAYPGRD